MLALFLTNANLRPSHGNPTKLATRSTSYHVHDYRLASAEPWLKQRKPQSRMAGCEDMRGSKRMQKINYLVINCDFDEGTFS